MVRLRHVQKRHTFDLKSAEADVCPSRSDINWVIMDYLVSEGYPGAAEKFAQETNLCQPTDIESIRERVRIRSLIHSGQIEEAISLINEVDPEVSSVPVKNNATLQMIIHKYHAPRISTSGC